MGLDQSAGLGKPYDIDMGWKRSPMDLRGGEEQLQTVCLQDISSSMEGSVMRSRTTGKPWYSWNRVTGIDSGLS